MKVATTESPGKSIELRRKVDPTGTITTFAGVGDDGDPIYNGDNQAPTEARINPADVAVDGAGNVYIADFGNARIRKVDASGTITTAAGNGEFACSSPGPDCSPGDRGPATAAAIAPYTVTVDGAGNLHEGSLNEARIRKIDTSGTITTVAEIGPDAGYSGDGRPADAASISPSTSLPMLPGTSISPARRASDESAPAGCS